MEIIYFLGKIFCDVEFWKLIIAISSPIIVAFLGIWKFKKQREIELVQKRYLDEGFDKLIENYEIAMASYRHNWQLSLNVLRQVNSLPNNLISKNAVSEYFGLGKIVLPTIAVHRVNNLLKSDKLWELHQLLYSFIQDSYFTFEYDFKLAIENYIDGSVKGNLTGQNIYDQYLKCFKDMNKQSFKMDSFIGYIKVLSAIFEKNNYTNNTLPEFKNREDVKGLLKEMKQL